jgi:glycosyltransferase involved in cell wall biosynthesis
MGVFSASRISPDILHIHGIGPSLFVPLARLLGLKVVITNHGPDYERKKWGRVAKFILALGESLGSRYSNGIICISDSIADRIKKRYKKETAVIPNGVALMPVFEDEGVIVRYGLAKRRYVLSIGRFVPEKGFHDLIEAFKDIEGWKLVIVGDADYSDSYTLNIKRRAAENKNIILAGFLTGQALRQLYANAGLFVLPSYYEGLPIVLLEAMGYGLSCIASDIPPNRDIGLKEGRFFKAGDVRVLTGKIKEFIERPLSGEEKKRQIEMIRRRYNWDSIANKTLEVYMQVRRKK